MKRAMHSFNYYGDNEKSKRKVKPIIIIFIYILTAIVVIGLTVSSYVTSRNATKVAKVAVMANSASVNIDLSEGIYPGFESVHTIALSNVEDNKVCDVNQKFSIYIEKDEFENIPLNYEIYKDQACSAENKIEPDADGNYSSEDFVFQGGVEEEKNYYLKIKWPENKNDEKYAFEVGYCKINIAATQID